MKKIIFILIILAVLLFSGCDAMLEVFYPEFAEDFSGNNILDIGFELSDFHYGQVTASVNPLIIGLFYNGEVPYTNTPIATVEIHDMKSSWYTYFLSADNYDIWIWCDVDNSGSVSTGDIRTSSPANVIFSGSDGYKYLWADPAEFINLP